MRNSTTTAAFQNTSLWALAIIFLLPVQKLPAQSTFEVLQRLDATFLEIEFAAQDKAFIVGTNGTILRSEDNGETWERQFAGTLADLYSIDFVDDKRATIVGANGTILRSRDGGESWTLQESGGNRAIRSVSFGNDEVGVLVGDEGLVRRTNDGGESWRTFPAPTDSILQKVLMLSENIAVAIGGNGSIIRSEDGGRSWERVYHDAPNCVDCQLADLSSDSFGTIYALFAGHLLHSEDQGKIWQVERSPRGLQGVPIMYAIDFVRPGRGILAGEVASRMLMTEDKGRTYRTTELADREVTRSILIDVKFRDLRHGIAVGALNSIYTTEDGGANWKLQSHYTQFRFNLTNMQFVNKDVGFIGGTNERIFRTDNGGATWIWQDENPLDTFYNPAARIVDLYFFNENEGLAFSSDIRGYLRTNDGGKRFEREYLVKYSRQTVDFCNDQFGFFAGEFGGDIGFTIKTTNNGGQDWKSIESIDSVFVSGVECVSSDLMLVCGQTRSEEINRAVIYRSGLPGEDWEKISIPDANVVSDIEFISETEGFAIVGYDVPGIEFSRSVIFRTQDAGKTWRATATDTVYRLQSLSFSTPQVGYATGGYGAFVKTVDGGLSWHKIETGTESFLQVVNAFPDGTAYIQGNYGSLFRVLPDDQIVSVAENNQSKVEEIKLPTLWTEEAFPNPFVTSISIPLIWFDDIAPQEMSIRVFNILGRQVDDLSGQIRSTGGRTATIEWAPDDLQSGVYIINFEYDGYSRTEQIFLMR